MFTDEDSNNKDKRLIPVALTLSVLLHGFFIWQWWPQENQNGPTAVIEISLQALPAEPQVLPPKEKNLPTKRQKSPPQQKPKTVLPAPTETPTATAIVTKPRHKDTASTNARISVTTDDIRQAINDIQEPGTPALTDNGAVVMDPELRSILNKSTQRTADFTILTGSGWSQFVKFGDKCFRVQEADPTLAVSDEKWFRVKCP